MDDISQVREKTDIVGLISEFLPLKKMGRNFKVLCPFHNEKTPSFVVSPERQIWHCFGCGKGGDCFTFLMEYENLEFPESLRTLAKKAGIQIRESNFQTNISSKKETIYKLNNLALDFYHYILTKHRVGKAALSYLLETRKLNTGLIETFKLGFSPKVGDALSNFFIKKKNYQKMDLVEAGLSFAGRNGILDFFRGRVMFPLFDHRGNVVGFSGRTLEDLPSDGEGDKYVNTRETLVYHKGSMFFGLNTAKEAIKKEDKAIVLEGEFDVIALFSIGVKNAVAIKGTALTENQVSLLSRFTKNVALCFDKDKAGYEATKRSLPILEKQGLITTIIEIPNAKDADEAIKKDAVSFKKALKKDISIYDYFFDRLVLSENKTTIEGKRKSLEILPVVMNIENEILKEHYLKKLSEALDTSYESVVRELARLEKKEKIAQDVSLAKKDKRLRREVLEEYLLSLIIQFEETKKLLGLAVKILQDYQFEIPSVGKIINNLLYFFKSHAGFNHKKFSKDLAAELTKTFDLCFLYPLPKFINAAKYTEELKRVARELRMLFLKDKIKLLSGSLRVKEKEEKVKEIQGLQKELSNLIHRLSEEEFVVK